MVIAPRRHPGKRIDKPRPDLLRNLILPPLTDAPALPDERRLRRARRNRLHFQRIGEANIIAGHGPLCAHSKAMLAVQAEIFILGPNGRKAVRSRRQHMDGAIAHASAARNAFFPIDTDHALPRQSKHHRAGPAPSRRMNSMHSPAEANTRVPGGAKAAAFPQASTLPPAAANVSTSSRI